MPAGFHVRFPPPSDVLVMPEPARLMYWRWVADLVLERKDAELSEGLDAHGSPLRPISRKTRRYRKSAMGPADPSNPPLTPAGRLSRTRSLLAARATSDGVFVWWTFDPWTHDSWSKILTHQKNRQGRDVFGLSDDGVDWVRQQALQKWMNWKRSSGVVPAGFEGRRVVGPDTSGLRRVTTPPPVVGAGKTDLSQSTFGIGSTGRNLTSANWSGGFTESELKKWAKGSARASLPGRPSVAYNRILSHIWGHPGEPGAGARGVQPIQPRSNPFGAILDAAARAWIEFFRRRKRGEKP